LDIATELIVRGPLLLIKLAEQCSNFEAFCQISTLFAVSDRTGFIEERMYSDDSEHDWQSEYERIRSMNGVEILESQTRIIGKFPNNLCYSKRMAEELLVKRQ